MSEEQKCWTRTERKWTDLVPSFPVLLNLTPMNRLQALPILLLLPPLDESWNPSASGHMVSGSSTDWLLPKGGESYIQQGRDLPAQSMSYSSQTRWAGQIQRPWPGSTWIDITVHSHGGDTAYLRKSGHNMESMCVNNSYHIALVKAELKWKLYFRDSEKGVRTEVPGKAALFTRNDYTEA